MKRLLAALVAIGAILIYPAVTNADSHELIVDGVTYQSTKEAGSSIHWETFDSSPLSATFAERGQTWAPGDNGSEHLPCDYGIHWISNDNVLTISHCLEAPPSTTGPTTTSSTSTTTSVPVVTSTSVATTAPVTEPTLPTTSSPSTSTEPSTTTQPPGDESSTTLSPSTSSSLPQTPPIQPPTTPPPAPSTKLPPTGGDTGLMAVWAVAVLVVGWALIAAARRRA